MIGKELSEFDYQVNGSWPDYMLESPFAAVEIKAAVDTLDDSMCAPSKEPPGSMRINVADKIRRRKARKAANKSKRRNR